MNAKVISGRRPDAAIRLGCEISGVFCWTFRPFSATVLLAAASTAHRQFGDDVIAATGLRPSVVNVPADVVRRIGDVIDNAGTSAQIAIIARPILGGTNGFAEGGAGAQRRLRSIVIAPTPPKPWGDHPR